MDVNINNSTNNPVNSNVNNDNTNNTNNTNNPQQDTKENYDFLFTEDNNEKDYKKLNKEEMIKKIQEKIKELREREDELHKKFKNGYIPLNPKETENYMKSFYQSSININNLKEQMTFSNTKRDEKSKTNMNWNKKNDNSENNQHQHHYNEKKDKKEKYNDEDILLDDEEISWMGKGILKMGKGVNYLMQFLNVFLGALFFIAAIYYFTGVHFDFFKSQHNKYYHEPPSIRKYKNQSMKAMEFKGYSLLMTPDRNSEAYQLLNRTVNELSQEYHTELFEPHLTLFAPIDLPLEDLKKKLISLSMMEPFELSMTKIVTGQKYYQCVLGTVEKTPDLEYVYRRTMELLELPQSIYFPHISLIYGNFLNYVKKHIMNEVLNDKNFKSLLPLKFTISQIEIWKTEGETKTWKCHDTIPFTIDNSDDDNDDDNDDKNDKN